MFTFFSTLIIILNIVLLCLFAWQWENSFKIVHIVLCLLYIHPHLLSKELTENPTVNWRQTGQICSMQKYRKQVGGKSPKYSKAPVKTDDYFLHDIDNHGTFSWHIAGTVVFSYQSAKAINLVFNNPSTGRGHLLTCQRKVEYILGLKTLCAMIIYCFTVHDYSHWNATMKVLPNFTAVAE